jgi:hypothetical protein
VTILKYDSYMFGTKPMAIVLTFEFSTINSLRQAIRCTDSSS